MLEVHFPSVEEAFEPETPADVEAIVRRLEELSDKAGELAGQNPNFSELMKRVTASETGYEATARDKIVREVASADDGIKKKFGQVDFLAEDLGELRAQIINGADMKEIAQRVKKLVEESPKGAEVLKRAKEHATRSSAAPMDIDILSKRKDRQSLLKTVEIYERLAKDPNTTWNILEDEHIISPELHDDINMVNLFFEANARISAIENAQLSFQEREAAIGVVGVDLIKRGFPPQLIAEALVDKEEFGADFLSGLVSNYINAAADMEAEEKLDRGRNYAPMATKVATAFLISSLLLSGDTHPPYLPPPAVLESTTQNPLPEESEKVDSISPDEVAEPESGGYAEAGSGKASDSKENSPSIPPGNDLINPEDMNNQEVSWTMEGNVPWDLFRTSTSHEFSAKAWKVFLDDSLEMSNFGDSSATHDFTLNRSFYVDGTRNQSLDIPLPYGYSTSKSRVEVIITGGTFPPDKYTVVYSDDGTFSLLFYGSQYATNSEVQITIGAVKDARVLGMDAPKVLGKYYEALALSDEAFPPEILALLETASKEQDQKKQAELLAAYIRNNFQYSLNPAYSDYYTAARFQDEFIYRIFKVGRADCDVANTALMSLLRRMRIPSRMVFGFNNGGALNLNNKELTNLEAHGWTEIFYNGQWIPIDATPISPDEYTRNLLNESGPRFINPLELIKSIKDGLLIEMLKMDSGLKRALELPTAADAGLTASMLATLALYAASVWAISRMYGISESAYNRNLRRFQISLAERIGSRRNRYYGNYNALFKALTGEVINRTPRGKLVRKLSSLTALPTPIVVAAESYKVARLKKQTDEAFKDSKLSTEAVIAKAAGTTVEIVRKEVKRANTRELLNDIYGSVRSIANMHIRDTLEEPDLYLYESKIDAVIGKVTDVSKSRTFEEFYEHGCRNFFVKSCLYGFPKPRTYERYRKFGGFEGFVIGMPVEFKRAMYIYWRTAKGVVE